MTKIVGIIADTSGTGLTGKLTVKLNAPLIDRSTTPDTVKYMKPDIYDVTNGDLGTVKQNNVVVPGGIDLQPSSEPTYQFSFTYTKIETQYFLADGSRYIGSVHLHTDSKWYTGLVHSTQSQLLTQQDVSSDVELFEPFNAGIPNTAQIEWADLQHSSINYSNIDTSLYNIAQLLTQGTLVQSLVTNIYNPKGVWLNTTQYSKGDVVYYTPEKGSYWYINNVPSSGNLPTNPAYWQQLISATEVVGGGADPTTVLLNQAFGVTWDGVINKAPTADVIYDQLVKYALLSGATFGSIQVPTRAVGENSLHAANMTAIRQALAAFVPPSSTTAPNISSINPIPPNTEIVNANVLLMSQRRYAKIQEEKVQGQAGGQGSASNTRYLEFVKENAVNNISGSENILEPIPPWAELKAGVYRVRGQACCCGVGGTRLDVINSSGGILIQGKSGHTGMEGYQASVLPNYWVTVEGRVSFDVATRIGLRHLIQTSGISTDLGRPCNRGGNEVYAVLEVWRMN